MLKVCVTENLVIACNKQQSDLYQTVLNFASLFFFWGGGGVVFRGRD